MTWFVCLPLFSQNSKRTIVSIAGIILISVALLGIPMVLADVYVDVLCVLDEE